MNQQTDNRVERVDKRHGMQTYLEYQATKLRYYSPPRKLEVARNLCWRIAEDVAREVKEGNREAGSEFARRRLIVPREPKQLDILR